MMQVATPFERRQNNAKNDNVALYKVQMYNVYQIIKRFKITFSIGKYSIRVDREQCYLGVNRCNCDLLKSMNTSLADQSTELLLYLMENEGKYLNTCIKIHFKSI